MPVVTRFAPSPTGDLHLGHALAAYVARLMADKHDGRCYLRMEDIDTTRCRPQYRAGIIEDLDWLGINFEPEIVIQSERFDKYAQSLEKLRQLGVLYPCFCTRKEVAAEIAAMGGAPQGEQIDIYPGTCRHLSFEQRDVLLQSGKPYCWRLDCRAAAKLTGPLEWTDLHFGKQQCRPESLGDVILARKDCPTSYHIAVVVDDAAQGVTLVTRGKDLFSVTGVHRTLQALLELPVPLWLHHELICDEQGKRLAKRDKARSLKEMRAAGMSPAEVLNLLDGFIPKETEVPAP